MITSTQHLAEGFLLRFVQILADSSHSLLFGFLVAAALRVWVGPTRLRAAFGAGRWSGPLRAWAAGVVLPSSALGVLPVLSELRRARVGRPALLTFALAAPMLNPIALAAGMSYVGPRVLGVLVLGMSALSIAVGVAWGYLFLADRVEGGEVPEGVLPNGGVGRLRVAAGLAAREASGSSALDVLIGMVGAAAVAALFPPSVLAEGTFAGDPSALLRALAVSLPLYLTPERGIIMVPEILKFRQSTGALFLFLTLGVGVTLGHLAWLVRTYGPRTAGTWMAMIVALALTGAVAVEAMLPPVGTANADNDHFDVVTNPFAGGGHLRAEFRRLAEGIAPTQWAACATLVGMVVAGIVPRRSVHRVGDDILLSPRIAVVALEGRRGEEDLGRSPGSVSVWDRPIPVRVLAALGAVGAVGVGLLGASIYFPSPAESFRDMQIIKADLHGELGKEDKASAVHHLDLWARQAGKLPIGAALRARGPDREALRLTDELVRCLDRFREAAIQEKTSRLPQLFLESQAIHDRCRAAYRAD